MMMSLQRIQHEYYKRCSPIQKLVSPSRFNVEFGCIWQLVDWCRVFVVAYGVRMATTNKILLVVTTCYWALTAGQYYSINLGGEEAVVAQPVPPPPTGGPVQEIRPKITPLDAMIDKTNHLGFRILYLHSKGNKNNIAFSPCALSSILVALYEGADGKSSAEIHENLVLPYDKDILRVGYRDIHRRLRSYFYRKENLLSGLTLSSENITIRPEYESILKFYGYDLENIPEMKMQTTTIAPTSPDSTETTTFPTDYMTSSEEEQTTTEFTMTTFDLTMGSAEPEEESKTTTESEQESDESESTTAAVTEDGEETETTTVADADETTEDETSEPPAEEEQTEEPTEEPPAEGGEKRRRNLRKRGQKQRQVQRRQSHPNYRRRMLRARRSPEEFDLASHQRFLQNFLLQDVTTASPFAAFPAFSQERANQFQQDRVLDDTIEHNFYLSETETVKVPYKIYNTILKYAYIDRLQSTVLELELDSDDYKLIIILPDYEFGLGNLMKLLQSGENVPNLRDIVKQMTPSWVKTIVPKFTLKGNIILTSDLQNMGINDIFEPTRADFTPMTEDPLIYAKHIEQSININIRTQSLQQLKRFTSLYKNPIELAINYPFLFCILDKELDLALITGRILNPLNSRIH